MPARMPKSSKERVREFRLRQDSASKEKYKRQDREHKQNKKKNMTKFELDRLRKQTKESVRRFRKNKAAGISAQCANTVSPEMGSFSSPQSLGKAMSRAQKMLPRSPRKRRVVIKKLAEKADLVSEKANTVSLQPHNAITAHVTTTVEEFYCKDDISRQAPGKNDVINVRDENGQKEQRQKRHLIMTLKEAHHIFKNQNPQCKIGFSKFAMMRPAHVLLSSKLPRNVCGCIYHANMILILEALHRQLPNIFPLFCDDFLKNCVCDICDKDCMTRECSMCKNKFYVFVEGIGAEELKKQMAYWVWKMPDNDATKVSRVEKMQVASTTEEVAKVLNEMLPQFLFHTLVKRSQSAYYEKIKDQVQNENNQLLIQVDFAENYKCAYQDEVQSAHWNAAQITIFTCVKWFGTAIQNIVGLSDVLEHEKKMVVAMLTCIIDSHMSEHPGTQKIFVFSDGPSSQFKNKYIMSYLSCVLPKCHPDVEFEYNFFATAHGKGPCDSLGGTAKRMVERVVNARRFVVKNALHFEEAINSVCFKGGSMVITEADIEAYHQVVKELWEEVAPIPGTKNIHQVVVKRCGEMLAKQFADDKSVTRHIFCANQQQQTTEVQSSPIGIDDFAVVKYEGAYFPGKVLAVTKDMARIMCMTKSEGRSWKWPAVADVHEYDWHQVIKKISGPKTLSKSRGIFEVPELDMYWGYK